MTYINRQKFLTELGKLLTFMYEEDRQAALAMYSRMFDDAGDEQALIQLLGSPTRQAVVVARAYNAKERKLQVHSQAKDESYVELQPGETPEFVLAIEQIAASAATIFVPRSETVHEETCIPVCEDQFSMFEDAAPEEPEIAPAECESATPCCDGQPAPAAAADFSPAPQSEAESSETASAEPSDESAAPDGDLVDEFIAEMSIPGVTDQEESAPEADIPESQPAATEPVPADVQAAAPVSAAPAETVRRARPALLVLYIIIAIPVTLVLTVLLLVPTLLSLCVSVGFIASGAVALSAAFSGFAVFADILVILGAALVLLALGLLFIWLFVWFIGGAIVGLIRAVIRLGRKWCYKEVPAV